MSINADDDETTLACPECDSTNIYRRSQGKASRDADGDETYRCWDCPARFDEPVRRPLKSPGALRGAAGELADAEPDEWP